MLVFIGYIPIYCKSRAKIEKPGVFFAPGLTFLPAYQEKMT